MDDVWVGRMSWRATGRMAIVWIVALTVLFAIGRVPEAREWWCNEGVGAVLSDAIGSVTGRVRFSIQEILELSLGFSLVVWLLGRVADLVTRRPEIGRAHV